MEKDTNYWLLHKKYYSQELDRLHKDIIMIIQKNPMSREAALLNQRIESRIEESLEQIS